MPGLEIVAQEHLPDLLRALQAGSRHAPSAPTRANGGRVRIRYTFGEQQVEEDVFGVVEASGASMPSMMGVIQIIFWMADDLFSCRAAAGHLESRGISSMTSCVPFG